MSARRPSAKAAASGAPGADAANPRFFATPAQWRAWLAANHARAESLWVGFRRVETKLPSITWPQSVDEALCYGWIDGLRKSLDATSYVIRFTPRKSSSNWSAVNVKRMAELERDGRVHASGRRAFEARKGERAAIYSYERRPAELPKEFEAPLRKDRAAWAWWRAAAPSYRKAATWWILTAKQDATRDRRLAQLAECCAKGVTVPPFRPRRSPHVGAAAKKARPAAKKPRG